jgi:starch-binding outer membrane protein SusE/F
MKLINKIKLFTVVAALFFAASCDKKAELPFFENGKAPVLSASSTTIAPAPADSNAVAVTLNWTNPGYATDSTKVKYIVQIDSTGRNFAKAVSREVTGKLTAAYVAKELNSILLAYGFKFNTAYDVDVRVISSYANNNEQYTSNVLKLRVTPYKIPPKVVLPTTGKLFLVGSASQGGWNNPVPVPTQEFDRVDETTFGGIFQLNGGQEYLVLPENGSWATKYCVVSNSVPGLSGGGDFVFRETGGDNIPAPSTTGWYKIMLDFQAGKFTVTPFTQQHGLPTDLFIVGDATPGGWNNPVPLPSQQFTRKNSTRFEMTLAMATGKKYLFLPENGSWGKKFGAVNGSAAGIGLGGEFKPEGEDMPAPDVSGNYKIEVNFINNLYKLTKQ